MEAGGAESLDAGDEDNGLGLDGKTLANGTDALVGLPFDVDAVDGEVQEVGEVRANGLLVGREFRTFEDDDRVGVDDVPARVVHAAEGFDDEGSGVRAGPAGIGVGEDFADVLTADRAEEGVGEGVEEGVAVGVAYGAEVVLDEDATDDEGPARAGGGEKFESVEVPAHAHAERRVVGVGSGFRHGAESTDKSGGSRPEPGRFGPRRLGCTLDDDARLRPPQTETDPMATNRPATRANVLLVGLLAAGFVGAGVGCGIAYRPYFDPGGSGAAIDEYTYVSEPYAPQTITVVDTRTGESVFAMDVPVGQQLVINFDDKQIQSEEWMSGVMRWRLMPAGQRYGRLTNRIAVPPPSSRRVDVTLRATPEFPPGGKPAAAATHTAEPLDGVFAPVPPPPPPPPPSPTPAEDEMQDVEGG